jgi:hypothetical protein
MLMGGFTGWERGGGQLHLKEPTLNFRLRGMQKVEKEIAGGSKGGRG